MPQTLQVRATFDASRNVIDAQALSNNNLDAPIGGLVAIQVVVEDLFGNEVEISSSSWTFEGRVVSEGSVTQTADEGTVTFLEGPLAGGYSNDPSQVAVAWFAPGPFGIVVSGTALMPSDDPVTDGIPQEVPFNVSGTMMVHAPAVNAIVVPFVSPITLVDDTFAASFNSNVVSYTCDSVVTAGEIGFLQIGTGSRFRGTSQLMPAQAAGSTTAYVDTGDDSDAEDGSDIFLWSTSAQPGGLLALVTEVDLDCENSSDFSVYSIPAEAYTTYIAYRAPQGGIVIESYIVVADLCQWGWSVAGVFVNGEWVRGRPTATFCGIWIPQTQSWAASTWSGNQSVQTNWSTIAA